MSKFKKRMKFFSEIRSGKGQRDVNQDRYLVKSYDADKQMFIICDGMGGQCHGEKAAQLAVRTFDLMIGINIGAKKSSAFFEKQLRAVEHTFTVYIEEHPDYEGMGTTVALLFLEGGMAHIFWAGDSRVFYLRKREILYQTEDHNLGTLHVRNGLISPKSIEYYYQKNILLNCILGLYHPTDFDYHTFSGVQKGDLFFLCSDGVTETLSDEEIRIILSSYPPDKAAGILELECEGKSEDNYTFIIAQRIS